MSDGTAGLIRLTFTVRGGLSVVGVPPANSLADVEINYSVAGGPSFILMRAQANDAVHVPFTATGTRDPLVGLTATAGALGGEGEVRVFLVPFTWGQPFDLKFGLIASTIPGQSATSTVDFTGSATLSGIQLQANGQPVHDFTITSESGTPYGPAGVLEPASGATALAGVVWLAETFRRRTRS